MNIHNAGRPSLEQTELAKVKQERDRLAALNAELLDAAKDVIKRWDAPLWEERKPTSFYMHKLREAIAKAGGEV